RACGCDRSSAERVTSDSAAAGSKHNAAVGPAGDGAAVLQEESITGFRDVNSAGGGKCAGVDDIGSGAERGGPIVAADHHFAHRVEAAGLIERAIAGRADPLGGARHGECATAEVVDPAVERLADPQPRLDR